MKNNRSAPKLTIFGWILIATFIAGALELAGYIFLNHMSQQYPKLFTFSMEKYVHDLPESRLHEYATTANSDSLYKPHPRLGWIRNPGVKKTVKHSYTISSDSTGSRTLSERWEKVMVATYGDSFTEGIEADDDETWQYYMGQSIGAGVYNFGVSGYGPDQALLYLEENISKGISAPIVILSMIRENLNRIMNSMRAFYTFPHTDIFLGFKPMFIRHNSGYELINFTPENFLNRDEILSAITKASEYDAFFNLRTECACFPYSFHTARFLLHYGIKPKFRWPSSTATAYHKLKYILQRFLADANQYGFVPVFVILPQNAQDFRVPNKTYSRIKNTVDNIGGAGLIYINVVQELSGQRRSEYLDNFDPDKFLKYTHPSAYGNKAIATVVTSQLKKAGVVP